MKGVPVAGRLLLVMPVIDEAEIKKGRWIRAKTRVGKLCLARWIREKRRVGKALSVEVNGGKNGEADKDGDGDGDVEAKDSNIQRW